MKLVDEIRTACGWDSSSLSICRNHPFGESDTCAGACGSVPEVLLSEVKSRWRTFIGVRFINKTHMSVKGLDAVDARVISGHDSLASSCSQRNWNADRAALCIRANLPSFALDESDVSSWSSLSLSPYYYCMHTWRKIQKDLLGLLGNAKRY